jgi:thioesterase domain-containing protein
MFGGVGKVVGTFETKEEWLEGQLKQWDDLTRSDNRYIEVSGEHSTLIGPKHVAGFQAVL